MSSEKILILGCSGILSTAVCEQALRKNYDVTCITRGNRDFSVPKGAKIVHGDVHHLETMIDKIENEYDAVMDFLTFNVSQLESKSKFLACRCRQYFLSRQLLHTELEMESLLKNRNLAMNFGIMEIIRHCVRAV